MTIRTCLRVSAASFSLVLGSAAMAQTSPQPLQNLPGVNPDRINEEQRRRLNDRITPERPSPSRPEIDAPAPAPKTQGDATDIRFLLSRIDFDPSVYLTPAELDHLAQPLIGRTVALDELQRVVDAINALYAERGLTTARAVLPAQPVTNGVVRIRLVEGRIGVTSVEGASGRSAEHVRRRGGLRAGVIAAPSALEQQLRVFNLNNDAQLRARMVPGEGFGRTDVVLTAVEPRRVSADVFIDNNGFPSTGTAEIGAVLRVYKVLSAADRLTGVMVASRGVRSGNLSLSTPIGERFRISATTSYGRTRVLFGAIAPLGVRGTSLSFGGDGAALLHVGAQSTVTATVALQTSRSRTTIGSTGVIDNTAFNVSAGIVINHAVPGFAWSLQQQATVATVRERYSGNHDSPVLFQGSAAITKAIWPSVQGRLHGDWQLATQGNLPGLLQYQIGGVRSSRAFSPGVAAGDRGFSASAEVAYQQQRGNVLFEPFLFVDQARSWVPKARASIVSLGGGLGVTVGRSVTLRATAATGVKHRGVPDETSHCYISSTLRF